MLKITRAKYLYDNDLVTGEEFMTPDYDEVTIGTYETEEEARAVVQSKIKDDENNIDEKEWYEVREFPIDVETLKTYVMTMMDIQTDTGAIVYYAELVRA